MDVIGGNAAAREAGIRTDRIVICVFALAGLLAALAGTLSSQWNQAIYGVIILVALILSRLTSGEEQTS